MVNTIPAAKLEVTNTGGTVPPTKYYVNDSLAYPSQWLVANKTTSNLARAIATRVFLVKRGNSYVPCPKPTIPKAAIFRSLNGFKRRVVHYTDLTPLVQLQDIPALYQGSKRKVYQRAVDSLATSPYVQRDSWIKAHTKVEKIGVALGTSTTSNLEAELHTKDPRVIQARTPRYNANLGRFLKLNEHKIFHGIDRVYSSFNRDGQHNRQPTVMKGLNAQAQGQAIAAKWGRFKNPRAIRIDAKRFDQHVSSDVLKFEHTFYTHLFRNEAKEDKELLAKLLKHQVVNHCTGVCKDGTVKYVVKGNRMSGDMNTGLGNVIIMTSLVFKFFEEARVLISQRRQVALGSIRLELINNGDDCSLLCEKEDLPFLLTTLEPFFLRYGFEMDVEGVSETLETIKFCQCHPILVGGHYVMVRDVRSSTAKDSINLGQLPNSMHYHAWRAAIAGCGLALCAGVPIMQQWYLTLGSGRIPAKPLVYTCGMHYLAHGLEPRVAEISAETRVSFYRAFGITPDLQEALEDQLRTQDVSHFSPQSCLDRAGVVGAQTLEY